jgi:lysophospholipase L1-like esterase
VPTSVKRNLLFGLITLTILFIVFELALRLVVQLSVDYVSRKDDVNYEYKLWQMHLFDSFMGMQESDPDLFWRMKPGYRSSFIYVNQQGFSGPEIRPRQPNEYRILFLGDSTPLGLGLAKSTDSFVWQVRALLQKKMTDRQIVVINGSVAGYTSWQCRRVLELKGEELKPDLVITYFGNNDPSYNGYLSDRELSDMTKRSSRLNKLLGRSYGYQLLKNVVLKLRETTPATGVVKERVSVSEFGENLSAIKMWCDRNGCRLMTCSVPTPNLWPPGIQFKTFAGGKDRAGRMVMADDMRLDFAESWSLCLDTLLLPGASDQWAERAYSAAPSDTAPALTEPVYRRQLAEAPDDPRLQNNLAVSLWKQGMDSVQYLFAALGRDSLNAALWYNLGIEFYHNNPTEAAKYLKRAQELDRYSLRIKAGYNQALRDFSSANAVELIDLENLYLGLPQREYFVDHCHPTSVGHTLLARQIVQSITNSLQQHGRLAPK